MKLKPLFLIVILPVYCLMCSIVAGCPLRIAGDDSLKTPVRYTADWSVLDRRPTPEWFLDAKFGIFIHWGVYSVPSWTRKGGYAEWYYRGYRNPESKARAFHNRVFGETFRYEDFAPLFKAELFEPDEWADFFLRSGAKYVVLTSKHHDGFCLWPSRQRPGWNSVETGPRRDLVGDLTAAVRRKGLRMGLYYSLAEWTNPLYTWDFPRKENDVDRYVREHMIPQFKDLVERYRPSLIFADGEWSHPAQTFRSEEIVSWLYNHPALTDEIIVNDRWGNDTRFKHGGYFATEYTKGMENTTHPWEECRGMGYSFGYNRNETADDYRTGKELIHMLIRLVSNGGNLLLNIGPAADGRIPEIMQERLLQIGRWLRVNGSAIYATRAWKYAAEGDDVRFTAGKDGNTINAICLRWPGNRLHLRRVKPDAGESVRLLGVDQPLSWRFDQREGLFIDLPDTLRDRFEENIAYGIRIEGTASDIATPPVITMAGQPPADDQIFVDVATVSLSTGEPGMEYYYTTDGTEPTFDSPRYSEPLAVRDDVTIKAFAWKPGKVRSMTAAATFVRTEYRRPVSIGAPSAGLKYDYAESSVDSLPDQARIDVLTSGVVPIPNLSVRRRDEKYVLFYRGFIRIPDSGIYSFYTTSDDGSKVWIGDRTVVDNDGLHGAVEAKGRIALEKGFHPMRIAFFQGEGDALLKVSIEGPGLPKQEVPSSMYVHLP